MSETVRKAFICIHCEGVYTDEPVTQCDCLEGSGHDFVEGELRYSHDAVGPKCNCPKCGNLGKFIRERPFPDRSGKVFMCETEGCEYYRLYFYPHQK